MLGSSGQPRDIKYNQYLLKTGKLELRRMTLGLAFSASVLDSGCTNPMKYIKTRMLIGCKNWEIGGSRCFSVLTDY